MTDMTVLLIHAKAGVGAGRRVARESWLRTLEAIRRLAVWDGTR